jgi:type I restriction enzyme S subunit
MEAVGEYGGLDLSGLVTIEDASSGYTEFQDGDVVVAKITPCFENGKGALATGLQNGVALGTTELHVLRPRDDLDREYLFYVTISRAYRAAGEAAMYGASGQKRVSADFINDFPVPLPPPVEQRAIAAFLDAQTARIDSLIAKKRELIEKLKEKRTAIISRTVTLGLPPKAARAAGLDPHPRLKPSGVEWIGDLPERWEVKPIKAVAVVGNGSTPNRENADYWGGDYPWLNSSVVNEEEVLAPSECVTGLALKECHLPQIHPPAVLVGITGEGKTRGMATTLRIEATINQHLAYIKPLPGRYDIGYLRRVLDRAYQYLRSESDGGGSTKGAITCDQLANLKIPCPSPRDQSAITDYLGNETLAIDQMRARVEEAIQRLQEYRAALITAAVTGKIDVRSAVTNADAAVPEAVA